MCCCGLVIYTDLVRLDRISSAIIALLSEKETRQFKPRQLNRNGQGSIPVKVQHGQEEL